MVHVRLIHQLQKLPGIGGQALHVPPLPFGIDSIEGQSGFATTRQPSNDHQFIPGNFHVNILQIVFTGAVDGDEFLHVWTLTFESVTIEHNMNDYWL